MTTYQKPSRREFVKGSAVAAGVAIAGGLSIARSAHAAGDDQIKIALIGCGGRGTGAASQCLSVPNENIKLIAVADVFEDKAVGALGILRNKHGDKVDVPTDHVFSGFDAYKKAIACDADLVLLDNELDVVRTWVGGECVFERGNGKENG